MCNLSSHHTPPFKPFECQDPETDEDSIIQIDSPGHNNTYMPAPSTASACFSNLNSKMPYAPTFKHHQHKSDSNANWPTNINISSASQSSMPKKSSSSSRVPAATFAPSHKSSGSHLQSNRRSIPSSINFPEQSSDDDEAMEMAVAPKAKLHITGNGRAATARRELLKNGNTSVLAWFGGKYPLEHIQSSSAAIIPSHRRHSTVQQPSPSEPALGASNSLFHGDHFEEQASAIMHERSPGNGPLKELKNKSSHRLSRPQCPKPPLPTNPSTALADENRTVGGKRYTLLPPPATKPDESGQYEASTCHQCRVKTTRPKMICDQSQDPNCFVRICHACLMVRTVYDDMPELRPPIFRFVPGGTMLCVKCRDICPCASCRRRRGEREENRRGLGSPLTGFYGMTPAERKQALSKKKEKQDAARLNNSRTTKISTMNVQQAHSTHNSTSFRTGPTASTRAPMPGEVARPESIQSCSSKDKSRADRGEDQAVPSTLARKNKRGRDQMGGNQSLPSNVRLTQATAGTASSDMDNSSAPLHENARVNVLTAEHQQHRLHMRDLELRNAANELRRQNAKSEAFDKAKMMQDFLRSGLSYERAMEATLLFLGPST